MVFEHFRVCLFPLCELQNLRATNNNKNPLAGNFSSGAIAVIDGFGLQPYLDHLGIEHVDLPDGCRPPRMGSPKMLVANDVRHETEAWLPVDAKECCSHSVALPTNFVTWTVP